MSSQEIADAAMSLPISERAALAQDLWQSIDNELEAFDGVTSPHHTSEEISSDQLGEVRRRIKEAADGTVALSPGADALTQVRQMVNAAS